MEGHWNFLGRGGGVGGGVLKGKLLETNYEDKLEFPWGRGMQKKPVQGVLWIFSGTV